MTTEPEIVFKTTVDKFICEVFKTANGFKCRRVFSTGVAFEEDFTEEDYQAFLARMDRANIVSEHA